MKTKFFLPLIALLYFFHETCTYDRTSLGDLQLLLDELFSEISLQLIKTIGTPSITNLADIPVIAQNINNFSLANKYLYSILNNENNTEKFIKTLAIRFKCSLFQATYSLNTTGARSKIFNILKETGEYDTFCGLHAFHKTLKRQSAEISDLVTFVDYSPPSKKMKLQLSFNKRYVITPWGDFELLESFPCSVIFNHHSYDLRSKSKLTSITNSIDSAFNIHCKKFEKLNTSYSFNNTDFAWKIMLLNTPELRDEYLSRFNKKKEPSLSRRRIALPCVDNLPHWAFNVFQKFDHPTYDPDNHSVYLSLKKSAINRIFYLLQSYSSKAHLNYKCFIRLHANNLLLYNALLSNLGCIYEAYVATCNDIQYAWKVLHLKDNPKFFSSIDRFDKLPLQHVFSEEERFIIIKEAQFSANLATLIENLADYYGLKESLSVGTAAQSSLVPQESKKFIYCWIDKKQFPEVYEKFGFKVTK